jgi:DNA invertase Pin-like site-specific DNA recombinase
VNAETNGNRYRGRKPSYSREQLVTVVDMIGQGAGVGNVASATGLTRQTVYRIRNDAPGAEATLSEWGL